MLLFFLFGWFVKIVFFGPYLFGAAFEIVIIHDFFPRFFRSNLVSAVVYPMVLLSLGCFATTKLWVLRIAAGLLVACAGILCLHQNTYNDATFVVSFWCALWLLWLSACAWREPQAKRHAATLASCIVGLMFLGGFVGKLTPAYWNGEIIGRIFLEQGGESPLTFLLPLPDGALKKIALSLIAKCIIVGEGLLALNLIVYRRQLWGISLAVIPMLIFFSSWRILSVASGLIGLLVAALILKTHEIKS